MKTFFRLSFTVIATSTALLRLHAAPAVPIEPKVVDRGPHHREWMYLTTHDGPNGQTVFKTNRYTELATGLHHLRKGEWVESKEVIDPVPGGAMASKGAHQVGFAANINTFGAINLLTPDEKRLRSHVLGLIYTSARTGQTVWIAEIKNSQGVIVGDNQVLYRDAFNDGGNGLKADIRYTYTLAGLEQDIIFRPGGSPLPPEAYGLDSVDTRLEVVTEFVEAPAPKITSKVLSTTKDQDKRRDFATPDFIDQTLDFGAMRMELGHAFSLPLSEDSHLIPSGKTLHQQDGRTFLIEAVEYLSVKPHLDALAAKGVQQQARMDRKPVAGRTFPLAPLQAKLGQEIIKTASVAKDEPGFVIDYLIVASATNFTFRGDTTYYVNGAVNLSGLTTIEGGAVVKATNFSMSYYLNFNGAIACQTSPYRPAVFTAKDDNSVGETIPGSTGVPSILTNGASMGSPGNYYGGYMIRLSGLTNYHLHDLRFKFLISPVTVNANITKLELENVQFIHCYRGGYLPYAANCSLRNVLYRDVYIVQSLNTAGSTFTYENVTFDKVATMHSGFSSTTTVTNSLFVRVTNYSMASFNAAYSATNTSGAGVFQRVGAGGYYLATSSPYRDVGTTNIHPGLLASLRTKTTYPPIVFSNAVISVPTNFAPAALRDTNSLDLGYHYDPLDYVFGGTDGNTNITFQAGTAVGWFRTTSGFFHAGHGLHMADRQIVTFDGRLDAPCYWVHFTTVQEGAGGLWEGFSGTGGITGWADQYSYDVTRSPEIRASFTRFCTLSTETHFRDDWGYLIVRANNSEFYNGAAGGYILSLYLTNCLGYRMHLGNSTGWPGTGIALRNCTLHGGSVSISRTYGAMPVSIRDSAFDNTAFSVNDGYASNPTVTDYSNNAFLTTGQRTTPTNANDILVSSFNWETGPLGSFYLPTNSSLINAGSRNATNAGLFHFTVTTNQAREGSSVVDIGHHSVALGTNNLAADSDGDGIPDYREDQNGNGSTENPETSFRTSDTDGDGLDDSTEKQLGTNPLLWDTDADGVNDGMEVSLGINPFSSDSDSDGLSDADELLHTSNPLATDTDGDGLQDGPEVHTFFTNPSQQDTDSDGLSDLLEIDLSLNPLLADSNSNGTPDANEDTDSDGMPNGWEVTYGLNPGSDDASGNLDGDGFQNLEEYWIGTNPASGDTDGDGLPDYDEYYYYYTNPTNPDTDGDGMYDYDEYIYGTSQYTQDSDWDGIPDGWEFNHGMNPNDYSDAYSDWDNDSLSNLQEYYANSYPWSSDTDGDALTDYDEYYGTTDVNKWDTDDDGLSDSAELGDYFTDPLNADSDYDGRTDAQELGDGTNPLIATSVIATQLAYFRFNAPDLSGDQGQLPLVCSYVEQVAGWSSNAVRICGGGEIKLKYNDCRGASGPNINCRNGTISFWFQPEWSSSTVGGDGPGSTARLFEMGMYTANASYGWWGLCVNSNGTKLCLETQSGGVHRTNIVANIQWQSGNWRHVAVTYSPSNSCLYIDGQLVATGSAVTNYPGLEVRKALGFSIGSDLNGLCHSKGKFDNLGTWNYPMAAAGVAAEHAQSANGVVCASDPAPCPPDSCPLHPIALRRTKTNGWVAGSQTIYTVYTGSGQGGDFGWLHWSGNSSAPRLAESLRPEGDACRYVNPDNEDDHHVDIGDRVFSTTGTKNSIHVRRALECLYQRGYPSVFPVYDEVINPGGTTYRVSGFVHVQIVFADPNPKDSPDKEKGARIDLRFLGGSGCFNQCPTLNPISNRTIDEDATEQTVNLAGIGSGAPHEAQVLTVTATSSATGIIPNPTVTYTSPNSTGTLKFTPIANANTAGGPPVTITVTVRDDGGSSHGGCDTKVQTFTVTVREVNDQPVAGNDSASTPEDTPLEIPIATLLANDSPGPNNENNQTLTLTLPSTATAQGGTVTLIAGPKVRYSPALNFSGTDTFTYQITDNGTTAGIADPRSAIATVTVTVTPVNDRPVVGTVQPFNGTEDTSLTISYADLIQRVQITDVDGPTPFRFHLQTIWSGTLTKNGAPAVPGETSILQGDSVVWTPPFDANGPAMDAFVLSVADGLLLVADQPAHIRVNVSEVNDPPIPANDSPSTPEDSALTIPVATLLGNDSAGPANESAQQLSFTSFTPTASTHGTVVLNGSDLIYTPTPNYNGPASFTYTVTDNGTTAGVNDFKSANGTVNITVTPVNDRPELFVKDLIPHVELFGTFKATGITSVARGPSTNRLYVSSTTGFFVVDITNPYSPRTEGFVGGFSALAAAVSADEKTAFVLVGSAGMKIVDLSNPSAPSVVTTLGIGYASMLAISPDRNTLYVAGSFAGCRIYDVSAPRTPMGLGQVGGGYISSSIALSADGQKMAFVELAKVQVLDVSTPASPTSLMLYWFGEGEQGSGAVFMGANTSVHVSLWTSVGLETRVLDWSGGEPSEPSLLATLPGDYRGQVTRDGTKLLGSSLYKIQNPLSPVRITSFAGFGNSTFAALSGDEAQAFTFTSDSVSVWDISGYHLKIAKNSASAPIGLRVSDVETPAGSLTLNAASSNPTLLPPAAFAFGGAGADRTLTITPVTGQQGAGTVTVTVQDTGDNGAPALSASKRIFVQVTGNEAPRVTAAYNQSVEIPQTATLSATATDDGFPNGTLTYSWSKVSGPGGVGFSSGGSLNTTASFSAPGNYTLRFTANDSQLSASANVLITVVENQPPVVNAGPDRRINTGGSATLSGKVTDDGRPLFGPIYQGQPSPRTLRLQWTSNVEGVAFDDPEAAITSATFPAAGTYRLTLTATEVFIDQSEALSASDEMIVTVVDECSMTYTFNVDFQKGHLQNVNFEEVPNELRLNKTTTPLPYVYLACSDRGTVVRIDAKTGQILGEYATAPGTQEDRKGRIWPSRLSVDSKGNMWVANSGDIWFDSTAGQFKSSVTRIGVVIGGTRGSKDGSGNFVPDPNGEYLAPPFIYNTCVDRHGTTVDDPPDGLIKTSKGRDNILTWTKTGPTDGGSVLKADDEAIMNFVRVRPTATGQ